MYGIRLERWNKATDWTLIVAAVLFLAAYAVQILGPDSGVVPVIAEVVVIIVWAMFGADYIVCLILAEHRRRWFVRHLLDLAIVILPLLRPLSLMRFITVLMIIQRNAGTALRGRVVIFTIGATVLTIFVAALAVYDAEAGQGGGIDTFGDAIWWAFETITTVGYGDLVPVTITGRIVAVGLMIGGVAIIGVVSASLASWIVERVADKKVADVDREVDKEVGREVATGELSALAAEVAALRAILERERGGGT